MTRLGLSAPVAALAAAFAFAGAPADAAGRGRALPEGAHYVALGSSFAAGAGIAPLKAGTPPRCGRSGRNYATLLAARLHLTLDDQTCGGAKTEHLLRPWNELAAQLDAVRSDTRLVTATIGGNDLNYVGFLAVKACGADGKMLVSGARVPCPMASLPTPAAYAALERNLRDVVRRVKARAPRARVIFVQYVGLVPDRPCDAADLAPDKAVVARQIGRRLAQVTARAARAAGGEVLAMDTLSRGHGPCDAEPWAFATKPVRGEGSGWHPTAAAHAAIADLLARRLSG